MTRTPFSRLGCVQGPAGESSWLDSSGPESLGATESMTPGAADGPVLDVPDILETSIAPVEFRGVRIFETATTRNSPTSMRLDPRPMRRRDQCVDKCVSTPLPYVFGSGLAGAHMGAHFHGPPGSRHERFY